MKLKKSLKFLACMLLILVMVLPSSLSTLAETLDYGEPSDETWEWQPIEEFTLNTNVAGIDSVDSESSNQILNGVFYEDGKVLATLHPYVEGIYDEDNNADALGTVIVNIYEDCDENWEALAEGREFTGLVSSGITEEIQLTNDDISVEVEMSDIPDTFIIEARYVLSADDICIFDEDISSFDYTESITWIAESTVSDAIEEKEVDSAYIENLNAEEGGDSKNYFVYRQDSALVSNYATYTIQACEEENTYILLGVPEEILEKYKTSEELSLVPQLLLLGEFDEAASIFYASPEGTKTAIPIKMSAFRPNTSDPQTIFDYDYKYAIEYVYPEDLEEESLQPASSEGLDGAKDIVAETIAEEFADASETDTAFETDTSVAVETVAEEETETEAKTDISETQITQDEEAVSPIADDAAGNVETPATNETVEEIIEEASNSGEKTPCGIKFTINTDPSLSDVYETMSYSGNGEELASEVMSGSTQYINESGVNGWVRVETNIKLDADLKFWDAKLYVGIEFDFNADYCFTCSDASLQNKKLTFSDGSPVAVLWSAGIGTGFTVKNVSGSGEVRGRYTGELHLKIGFGFDDDVAGKKFDNEILKYWSESDTVPLKCDTRADIDIKLKAGYFKALFIEVGPILQATITVGWGTAISGTKDTEQTDGILHLCNTNGTKAGCTHGTYSKYTDIDAQIDINFWLFGKENFKWNILHTKNPQITFYSSKEYNDTGDGICPYKTNGELTAYPAPGVYPYASYGLHVQLKGGGPKREIYYAVVDPNSEEEPVYKKYENAIKLEFDFDEDSTMSVRTIYAYLVIDGEQMQTQEFRYIMLNDGIDCLMIPEEMTLPVGESDTLMFIHPDWQYKPTVYLSDEGIVTYELDDDNSSNGIDVYKITGKDVGVTEFNISFRSIGGVYDYSGSCMITVTDDIAKPTAQYGTNLYILRNINTSEGKLGDYKDNNTNDEANAPYFYVDKTHSVGEVLSHPSWIGKTEITDSDIQVYYTTDGSEPTTESTRFDQGEKVYLKSDSKSKTGYTHVTLKAIAYDPVSQKKSDVATWEYILLDMPQNEAKVIMIPTTKYLNKGGLGLCLAIYIPSLADLLDSDCWISVNTKLQSKGADPIPCFKVEWKWRSSGWFTVPVLGTNEWITEPLIGVDFVQTAIVIGLKETGKDKYVSITAEGQSKKKHKGKGECKVYVLSKDSSKTYTVDYDANGGEGAPASQTKEKDVDLTLSNTVPTRTNYEFEGWSTSPNGSVKYKAGDTYTGNSDVTLYAVWTTDSSHYLIKYDANGGSGEPDDQEKEKDVDLTLSSTKPTRSGYRFIGWSEDKTATAADYIEGDKYTKNADATLYAVWSGTSSCRIIYDANGGKNAPGAQVKEPGNSVTLSTQIPTWEGHVFRCWCRFKQYSSMYSYNPGATFSENINTDITLYAIWRDARNYTVHYDANGGYGAPADQTKVENVDLQLSSTEPAKTGYVFKGWAETNGGKVVYQPGDQYTKNNNVTLYAVYEKKTDEKHKVTVINGTANGETESYYYPGATILVKADVKEHKYLNHWDVDGVNIDDSELLTEEFTFIMPNNDVTLEAVFDEDKSYTLTVINGKIDETGKTVGTYYEGDIISITEDGQLAADSLENSKAEKKFRRWTVIDGDLELKNRQDVSEQITISMPASDVTIEASFAEEEISDYNFVVENGKITTGTYKGETQGTYEAGETVTAKCDEKEGQVFDHWEAGGVELTEDQKTSPEVTITMPDNNVAICAVYEEAEANEYTLSVEKGTISSGTYSGGAQGIYKEGDKVSVKANTYDGKKFNHWEADGITLSDAQKNSESFELTMPAKNVKLTAVFDQISQPYKLEVINGSIEGKNASEAYFYEGDTVTVVADDKDDCFFNQWNIIDGKLTLSDNQKKFQTMTFTMPASDVILSAVYAKDEISPYRLEVINGTIGSGSQTEDTFYQGTEVTVVAKDRTDEGLTFDGWKVVDGNLTLTESQINSSTMTFTMPADDVIIAATYSDDKYSLYVVNGTIRGDAFNNENYGEYYAGDKPFVVADEISGMVFDHWEAEGITLTEKQSKFEQFEFEMPENDVILTAVYVEPMYETYKVKVIYGTLGTTGDSDGTFFAYDKVTALADDRTKEEKTFKGWEVLEGNLVLTDEQKTSATLEFDMPESDVTLRAIYSAGQGLPYTLVVLNGTITKGVYSGDFYGEYHAGDYTGAVCDAISQKTFDHWEATGITLTDEQKTSESIDFVMPSNDVVLTAVYKSVSVFSYDVRVINGKLKSNGKTSGAFFASENVTPVADEKPATAATEETAEVEKALGGLVITDKGKGTYKFKKWVVIGEKITLSKEQETAAEMTFIMPDTSVTIVAAYEFTAENNVVPSGDSNSTLPWIIAIVISSFALISAAYAVKKKTRRQ